MPAERLEGEPALLLGRPTGVFVGRQTELAFLQGRLCAQGGELRPVVVCAVQGMPGVGKSYLCDQFYQANRGAFPGGYIVLSLAPGSQATAETLLVELAARLRLDVPASLQAQAVAARLRQPPMLLHIENVDDEALATAVVALTQQLVGCAVLVSARQQDVGLSSRLRWERVALSPLPKDEGLEQLTQEFRPPKNPQEASQFQQIVAELGALPLAIHLIASRLARGQRLDSLLKDLQTQALTHKAVDPGERSRQLLAGAITASIRALEHALQEDGDPELTPEQVAPALAGFAQGPAAGVGDSLAYALLGLGDPLGETLLLRARGFSLIERIEEPHAVRWRMHPLIAATVSRTSSPSPEAGLTGMGAWFRERLPQKLGELATQQAEHWQAIQAEEAALLLWLERLPPERAPEVARTGLFFAAICGPYAPWGSLCQRGLAVAEAAPDRLALLQLLSDTQRHTGQLDDALQSAQKRADLAKASGDGAAQASAQRQIADIYQARGQFDEALRIHREEVLPVFERLGLAHDATICRWRMARYLLQRQGPGDRQAAQDLLSQAYDAATALKLPEVSELRQELEALSDDRAKG